MVSHSFPLSEINQAFEFAEWQGKGRGRGGHARGPHSRNARAGIAESGSPHGGKEHVALRVSQTFPVHSSSSICGICPAPVNRASFGLPVA